MYTSLRQGALCLLYPNPGTQRLANPGFGYFWSLLFEFTLVFSEYVYILTEWRFEFLEYLYILTVSVYLSWEYLCILTCRWVDIR